jgi:hypothetical protein
VQLGRLRGADLVRAHRPQRELVRTEQLEDREPAGYQGHRHAVDARAEQRDHEDDVHEAQQEHRERHPELEPGVLAECGGSRHVPHILAASRGT